MSFIDFLSSNNFNVSVTLPHPDLPSFPVYCPLFKISLFVSLSDNVICLNLELAKAAVN